MLTAFMVVLGIIFLFIWGSCIEGAGIFIGGLLGWIPALIICGLIAFIVFSIFA